MTREEQIKAAWESAFKNVVESIDSEITKEEMASMFFELGCRWSDENKPVDWQQVRIQASVAAMQSLRSNTGYNKCNPVEIAKFSVNYADELVKELKG